MKKIELLAPAGNFECLVAAVQSGADAVYLSGKAFGARSYADNFDKETLEKAVDYCHLRGAKVYVTVNTLVTDSEMQELSEYLVFLNNIGTDAIIVQDVGVMQLAKQIVPELLVHASTQMTVHNADGVKALGKYGVNRVVLAREVPLENIKRISENTEAELEVFAHGALCMCYSGQCLMSSIIGGRSGNRGKCAQPCRLPYSINGDRTKKFYMSLKDLSSVNHISELMEIGVTSLKIEGRMKGPAYVAAVVGVYRKYIDNPHPIEKADAELLDRIFNRGGVTDGYLTGKVGREMFAFDKPDNPYHKGSDALEQELLSRIKNENRKLSLKCKIEIKIGQKPVITVCFDEVEAVYEADFLVESAQKLPLSKDAVKAQLSKTGGTPFEFSKVDVFLDADVFVSAGALNNMRRAVLEKFEELYINRFKRQSVKLVPELLTDEKLCEGGFVCEITTIEQFKAVKGLNFIYFYVPLHIIEQNREFFEAVRDRIVIALPAIIAENRSADIEERAESLLKDGFFAVQASNIAQTKNFDGYRMFGGFRLNIFNSGALNFYKNSGIELSELSPELNVKQIQKIKKVIPVQTMVYGRLPLMVTENCVIRNNSKCPCNGLNTITDRMGMVFPVIKDGEDCRSVVLNCKKTFLGYDMDKLKRAGVSFFRLYFTDESPEECMRVCESFFENSGYRPEDFTGGHFAKGVQ
ncbi:MAG: U32 family peptidase [Ruminococcaceae bacterium]|nr:U32 family peptidase [Oscillospiraceae bacterium]